MKPITKLTTILAALAAFSTAPAIAVEGAPDQIDYQGQLLNNLGGRLTSSGGTDDPPGPAKNFEIRFRIWNEQAGGTAANLMWAEKQIVTVDGAGFFSVRLGEGEAITDADGDLNPLVGTAGNLAGALLTAFDGSARFLGVTVMNPPATPGEITPRLAFLSSPYSVISQTAKFAESGPDGEIFNAQGIEVTDNLGVGTATPSADLHVLRPDNDIAQVYATGVGQGSGLFYAGQSNSYGGGFAYDGDGIPSMFGEADRTTFFSRRNSVDTEVFSFGINSSDVRFSGNIVSPTGSLGLGVTTPNRRLHVSNGASTQPVHPSVSALFEDDSSHYLQLNSPNVTESGILFGRDNSSTSAYMIYTSSKDMLFQVNQGVRMALKSSGNVGIGTTAPAQRLHVAGNSVVTGNLGVGTTAPGYKLEALGSGGQRFRVVDWPAGGGVQVVSWHEGTGDNGGQSRFSGKGADFIDVGQDSVGDFTVETNDIQRLKVSKSNGSLSVLADALFNVPGDNIDAVIDSSGGEVTIRPSFQNNGYLGTEAHYWWFSYVRNNRYIVQSTFSDRRTKKGIEQLDSSLDKLMKLEGVSYQLDPATHPFFKGLDKEDEKSKKALDEAEMQHLGFIAQDLQKVLPEMVREDDSTGYLVVQNYEQLFPVVVEGIKELRAEKDAQIRDLEERLARLEALMAK